MTTDLDIAIIQLRECAQSIGTYLPASSAATIAAAWDALIAERDTLANANAANVGLLRKAEAERDEHRAAVAIIRNLCAARDGLPLEKQSCPEDMATWAVVLIDSLDKERDAYKAEADEAQRANDGLAQSIADLAKQRDAALARVAELEGEEFTARMIDNNIALQTDLKCTRLEIQSLRAQLDEAQAESATLRHELKKALAAAAADHAVAVAALRWTERHVEHGPGRQWDVADADLLAALDARRKP